MKVLKVGILPEPDPPWPINVMITCSFCACQFVLETQSDFTTTAERCPGGLCTAIMPCPTCGRIVAINRPQEVL